MVECTGVGCTTGLMAHPNSGDATWFSAEHLLTLWTTTAGDFSAASASKLATDQTAQPITRKSTSAPA